MHQCKFGSKHVLLREVCCNVQIIPFLVNVEHQCGVEDCPRLSYLKERRVLLVSIVN